MRRESSTPTRPDQWWVADFTYVWTLEGFVYTGFVTDVFSRRILGWRMSDSKATPLVMSALEQALFTRRGHDARFTSAGLVFPSDAGSQGEINWSSHHLDREALMGRPTGWVTALPGRSPMKSPGAPSLRREVKRDFWRAIATGVTSEEAAIVDDGLALSVQHIGTGPNLVEEWHASTNLQDG